MAHGKRDGCDSSMIRSPPRRAVMIGLLTLASGGGASASPSIFPPRILHEINELVEMVSLARLPGEAFSRAGPEITARFDGLVAQLLAISEGPVNRSVLRSLLENPVGAQTLSASLIDETAKALLPVAVVRYLVGTCGLSFIFSQAPAFERFVHRYGADILSVGVHRFEEAHA